MFKPPLLSEKLKESTKYSHQLLEKELIKRIKSLHNQQNYIELLSLFYSFFGGLEIAIDKCLNVSCLPDYVLRRKTAALAEDLIALKALMPALADGSALPGIHSHLHALGALYVIEGSTLGGKIICKMIGQQLNLPDLLGLSFFNGYGDQTEGMWQTFKESIDKPLEACDQDIIIQSANDTFIQFKSWLDH